MSPEKKERHCEKVFSILAKISVQGLRNLRNSYSTLYANSLSPHYRKFKGKHQVSKSWSELLQAYCLIYFSIKQ